MANTRKTFLFNLDWIEILKELPSEVKYEVYDAIMEYAASGILLELEPTAKGVFLFIKKEMDYNESQYQKTVNARKLAGSQGGKSKQANRLLANVANVANVANANFAKQNKQSLANGSINDNDNVNVNVNVNDNNLTLDKSNVLSEIKISDPVEDKGGECEIESPCRQEISYSNMIGFFNQQMDKENAVISRIQRITEKRKKAISARCREYGKEAIFSVIVNASRSDFLNGRNNRNWVAEFDWIFLPNNFPKVLEGNFNNKDFNCNEQTNGTDTKRHCAEGRGANSYPQPRGKITPEFGLLDD